MNLKAASQALLPANHTGVRAMTTTWEDEDDLYTDYGADLYVEDDDLDDDHYCAAPGRGPFGLCADDMCRGAGLCMYATGGS